METETYNKTDVQLTYLYVFNVGMAPALKAQVNLALIFKKIKKRIISLLAQTYLT